MSLDWVRCDGCGMRTSPEVKALWGGSWCPDCQAGTSYLDGPRPLAQALHVAERIRAMLSMHCSRVEIAGSIRRRCERARDIEIVAVPSDREGLHQWAVACDVRWIKPATSEIVDWPPKREAKYLRAVLCSGIKMDLFLAEEANFGLQLAIRTGSADFSRTLVTHARRIGMPSAGGYLRRVAPELLPGILNDAKALARCSAIPTPEEQTAFDVLGLEWTAPEERTDAAALQVIRRAA